MLALRQAPEPQAILILDGTDRRVQFGATFASLHPELPVWISGYCAKRAGVYTAFETTGVAVRRIYYDLRATDTVTHFTTLVSDYVERDIHHVYMVTSDFHMARAKAIATLVFGSRGVAIAPVSEPTNLQPRETEESWLKVGRDTLRSLSWLVVGRTGAHFNGRTQANCKYLTLADYRILNSKQGKPNS